GDDELFSREQLVEWFDGAHLSRAPSQWDPKKLNWVNAHYLRQLPLDELATRVTPRIVAKGGVVSAGPALPGVLELLVPRAATLELLADEDLLFYAPIDAAAIPADLA